MSAHNHDEEIISRSKHRANIEQVSKVKATYRFPNNMVATFGHDDQQIPELQGKYSKELADNIRARSDDRTVFNGF